MAAPPRADSPRTARLVRAIQDLAEDTLESSAQIHMRIDLLASRLHSLASLVTALQHRIAELCNMPDATDSHSHCFLYELD